MPMINLLLWLSLTLLALLLALWLAVEKKDEADIAEKGKK